MPMKHRVARGRAVSLMGSIRQVEPALTPTKHQAARGRAVSSMGSIHQVEPAQIPMKHQVARGRALSLMGSVYLVDMVVVCGYDESTVDVGATDLRPSIVEPGPSLCASRSTQAAPRWAGASSPLHAGGRSAPPT